MVCNQYQYQYQHNVYVKYPPCVNLHFWAHYLENFICNTTMKVTFANVITILKYLCTFVLFITFFSVFAEPATNEFLREVKISVKVGKLNVIKSFFYSHKVVVKESQYYTQSITAPAILICPDFGQNQKVSFRISR